jgi:GDP-L-fucose synthase
MSRLKVVILGATGFIGRNLTETLGSRDDLEVFSVRGTRPAYDCPGVTWHLADLRDKASVDRVIEGMDVVIHTAATTSGAKDIVTQPHIHVADNAIMTALVLRAAFTHRVRHFIYFSCSIMYPSRDVPWREDEWRTSDEIEPRYFAAGWTKLYAEKMCEFYAGLGVTRHTVIRHTNVYGPHDKFDLERSHVFGATVTKVMTARGSTIPMWGTGEEARDLLYVDDLVRFVELAMRRQKANYEMVHVGYGQAVQLNDVVQRIIASSGRSLTVEHDLTKPTIPTRIALDCARARKLFDWEPQVGLTEGIRRTLEWWRSNKAVGIT